MPITGLIKLYFSVVDHHFGFERGEPQVLNPEVWKKESQDLLDIVLEKGCNELYVEGREKLIGLDPKCVVDFRTSKVSFVLFCYPTCLIFAAARDIQNAIESDFKVRRKKQKWKNLLGPVQLRPFMKFAHWFFAPGAQNAKLETPDGQKVARSLIMLVCNIKQTKVSIHSDMLLRHPFFEWMIAMLNSGASTISALSMKI